MRCVCGLIVALSFLAGCDRGTSGGGNAFRVAMILPGSDTDKGWNQMAREGLDRIRSELGAETKVVTNVKSSEFAGQIDYFAAEGYGDVGGPECGWCSVPQREEKSLSLQPGDKAVIGDEQVDEIVDRAREHGEISIANQNAPGQIVLSGVIPALVFALVHPLGDPELAPPLQAQ